MSPIKLPWLLLAMRRRSLGRKIRAARRRATEIERERKAYHYELVPDLYLLPAKYAAQDRAKRLERKRAWWEGVG